MSEHDWRTIRTGRTVEPRLSRADERLLTEQVRERVREREAAEKDERAAEVARRIDHARQALDSLRKALGPLDRATYRDLDRARRALGAIQARQIGRR